MSQAVDPVAAQPSPRVVAALMLGVAVLFLGDLGGTDLWAPDEPRYAHVADEVFSMRHGPEGLVLLHLNGEPYAQKPPLYYWLASLASLPGGRVSEWSARLPSALAGLAAVWLTFQLGRVMFDGRTGAWAAALLATVFDFAFLARHARLDVLLTLAVLVALFCFWRLDRGRGSPRANVAGLHAAMGLGILVKGPVALLPLLAAAVYLAWERRLSELRRAVPPWAFALSALPGLAWVAGAVALAPEGFFHEAVVMNTAGRFFTEYSKVEPWYFFFYQFPVNFLPWTLLWPLVFVEHRLRLRLPPEERVSRAAWRLGLSWVATWFVFFSFSTGKRDIYLLPCFPGVAIVCAAALESALSRTGRLPAWVRRLALGAIALVGAAGVAVAALGGRPMPREPEVAIPGLFGAALVAIAAAAALAWRARRTARERLAVLIATVATAYLAVFVLAFPAFEPSKSPRPIAAAAAAATRVGEPIGLYRHEAMLGALAFYSQRRIVHMETEDELREFLAQGGRVVTTRVSHRRALERVAKFEVISTFRSGRRQYLVTVARGEPAVAAPAFEAPPGAG
jgi:4-amino-4-deoxy-L-arabinose transferase-like glycosyltransferase